MQLISILQAHTHLLLIDGDMRSPSVHHLGNVGHDHGVSNFLAGDDNYESSIFHMDDLNLDAMSAGPIPPNAAELLTGARMRQLIDRLHENYDHVVFEFLARNGFHNFRF